MRARLGLALAGILLLAGGADVWAGCSISNETNTAFTVTSGQTSNQIVGAHTTTSIAPGKIVGKSKDGKSIAGTCKDGDKLIVKEDKGVPILMPK